MLSPTGRRVARDVGRDIDCIIAITILGIIVMTAAVNTLGLITSQDSQTAIAAI